MPRDFSPAEEERNASRQESSEKLVARDLQMSSDIVEDRPQGSHAEGSMLGDRYVMLVGLRGGQADVTSGLPGDRVADASQMSRARSSPERSRGSLKRRSLLRA